ncbi:hypothetical protein D3I60_04435 [Brevibacterium permense]|nr:hypothetical protein [Brevibacterium permense]
MMSQEEHRRQLRRADMLAAVEARQQERRRQAEARRREVEEQARQAEEARRAVEARMQAAPSRSPEEVVAAFGDWDRRRQRGGRLASQRF